MMHSAQWNGQENYLFGCVQPVKLTEDGSCIFFCGRACGEIYVPCNLIKAREPTVKVEAWVGVMVGLHTQ